MLAASHEPALEGLITLLGEATTLGEALLILGRATPRFRLERVERRDDGSDVVFRVATGDRIVVACARNGAVDAVTALV